VGEVLVSGPPERPARRWLRVVVAGGLVLAAAGFLGPRLLGLTNPEPAPTRPTRSAAATAGGPTDDGTTDAGTTDTGTPNPGAQPRLDGVPGDLPAGVLLAFGGSAPTVLGDGSGPVTRLDRLPLADGELVTEVLPTPSGLVALVQRATWADGTPSSRIYALGRTGGWRLLAEADGVVLGHRGDRVFASSYSWVEGTKGSLLEVSLTGKVLARHATPFDFGVSADTPDGLLVWVGTGAADAPRLLEVVDARTLAIRTRVAQVGDLLGATAERAVWTTNGCTEHCRLTVANLTTGARTTIPVEPGFDPGQAAVSPDGRHLAVGYWGRHPEQSGGAAAGFVDVVDLTSGRTTRVPGVATATKHTPDLAWTPDGAALALAVDFPAAGSRRAGVWPVSGGPVRLLSGEFAGGQSTLVALPSS
jgi:hypothetical protein